MVTLISTVLNTVTWVTICHCQNATATARPCQLHFYVVWMFHWVDEEWEVKCSSSACDQHVFTSIALRDRTSSVCERSVNCIPEPMKLNSQALILSNITPGLRPEQFVLTSEQVDNMTFYAHDFVQRNWFSGQMCSLAKAAQTCPQVS